MGFNFLTGNLPDDIGRMANLSTYHGSWLLYFLNRLPVKGTHISFSPFFVTALFPRRDFGCGRKSVRWDYPGWNHVAHQRW